MNISIGPRWESFVEAIVAEGHYDSASEVVRDGLRLVQEREQKLAALRETIAASLAEGESYTWDEVMEEIQAGRRLREAQRA